MIFEKMFGNLFGIIWLIIFILAILALLIWMFIKKNYFLENGGRNQEKELIKEIYKDVLIEENKEGKFEIQKFGKIFDSVDDCKIFIDVLFLRNENNSNYEVFEAEGFFKVRKKNSERTLRKFYTREEAEDFIKEKEEND